MFERTAPLVAMSAVSDMVNGWPGGIIQAARDAVFVTPVYHVNRMYAAHPGRDRLRARVQGPTYDSSREGRGVPALDAVASRSADGRHLFLKLVNTDLERELDTRVELRGVRVEPRGEMTVLAAPDLETRVGFASPGAIAPRTEVVEAGSSFRLRLPRHSVAVVTLTVQGGATAAGAPR